MRFIFSILCFLLLTYFGANASVQTSQSDTTINAIQIKHDVRSNTWVIEWLRPVQNIRIVIKRLDGKKVADQTFGDSPNGDWRLVILTPGFYTVGVRVNNELPFFVHLFQTDFPRPVSDD